MEELKTSLNNENQPIHEESSIRPPTCRICYDIEKENNLLIHPCRCTGSVKFVHEECLKTWLLSTNEDLSNRSCELCHTTFLMEYKIISYFSLREICDETIGTCMFIPILLSILGLIIVIIYFLGVKYESSSTSQNDKVYSLALMAGCAFAGGVILIILIYIIKSTFIKVKMEDWCIKNQEFNAETAENKEEERVVMTCENEGVGGLIVVPKVAKVGGKKIRAPKVVPLSLVPVYEGSRMIGYKSEIREKFVTSCVVFTGNGRGNLSKSNSGEYEKHNVTL